MTTNPPLVLVDAPVLTGDDKRTPHAREIAERRVAATLIAHLAQAGFLLHSASDGEERHQVKTAKEALEVIFSVDESWLYVRKPDSRRTYVVVFVLGNADDGSEVISDHSAPEDDSEGFGRAMDAFDVRLNAMLNAAADLGGNECSAHGLV